MIRLKDIDFSYKIRNKTDRIVVDSIINPHLAHHDFLSKAEKKEDRDFLWKAYKVAEWAHRDMKRHDGKPYISHPVEVARIISDYNPDKYTLAAAFLHDTVEDNPDVSVEDIIELFGERVAGIVKAMTILTNISHKVGNVVEQEVMAADDDDENHENQHKAGDKHIAKRGKYASLMTEKEKKLKKRDVLLKRAKKLMPVLMAAREDPASLILKLADRLHNMRTLKNKPDSENKRMIAEETLSVYATLAESMGLSQMKADLQDLAFRYTKPEEFDKMAGMISELDAKYGEFFGSFVADLNKMVKEDLGIKNAEIYGRQKHIYSTYLKMVKNHKTFSEIYDKYAARIIVEDMNQLNLVSKEIQNRYKLLGKRMKDYINNPKPNGYRSLHITIIECDGKLPIEIQLRTFDMHRYAERGLASHWSYKEGIVMEESQAQDVWQHTLRTLNYLIEDSQNEEKRDSVPEMTEEAYLSATDKAKDLMTYNSEWIMVLTPNLDAKVLPQGATVLDFAFQIHTEVGLHFRRAFVDGRAVPRNYVLHNAETVRIEKSKTSNVSTSWLKHCVLPSSRSKIKSAMYKGEHKNYYDEGVALMQKREVPNISNDELLSKEVINEALKELNFAKNENEFYEKIHLYWGTNNRQLNRIERELVKAFFKLKGPDEARKRGYVKHRNRWVLKNTLKIDPVGDEIMGHPPVKAKPDEDFEIYVDGIKCDVKLAKCCSPLPGDPIVALKLSGRNGGVKIHKSDCPGIQKKIEEARKDPTGREFFSRFSTAVWKTEGDKDMVVTLLITARDRAGLLNDLTNLITRRQLNLLKSDVSSLEGFETRAMFSFEISNLDALDALVRDLENLDDVTEVKRVG